MGTVVVALEDGFVDDHVVVRIDGRVVLDAPHVTTRAGLGLAASVATTAGRRCVVEVTLPVTGCARQFESQVDELTYVRVVRHPSGVELTPAVEFPRHL